MPIRTTLLLALLALVVGAGSASWFLTREPSGTVIDASGAAVVKEMRALGRLETASYTIEKIIEASKGDSGPWRDILFGDKLLLIAHGEAVAGVDLSTLAEDDVRTIDGTMTLSVSAAELFSVRLDNERTRVYDRDQGLLTRGDKDLESEARQAAEASIRQAACEAGILDSARDNARRQLETLLAALGFEGAVIDIPPSSC